MVNAPLLEAAVNDQTRGINNIDLSGNGSLAYVFVRGYGNGYVKGYKFLVDAGSGGTVQVADLQIRQMGTVALVTFTGNPQFCGPNYLISYSRPMVSVPLFAWTYSHPVWMSDYGYGRYPQAYIVSRPRVITRERIVTREVTRPAPTTQNPASSPVPAP